ncbi:MAG: hypothetical protein K2I71_05345, partial [Helicobacter sp.]|nr:hypothetical protein [Helicobacter sp.]
SEKGNTLFKEGGLGKIAMHTSVGGVIAALNKQDFLKGAILGGIHESISPLRGNPLENTEKQILISKVHGAILGGLLGGESLMEFGSRLNESAERYNRELHYDGRVVAMDRVDNGEVVELTDGEYLVLSSMHFPDKDESGTKLLYPAYKDNGVIIYNAPITKEFTNRALNLNNLNDFEYLRRKTDMGYENIHPNTSIIFMNGMGNTLEDARGSANLIQKDFLNQQVGLVNNATQGLDNDFGEWKANYLTTKDSLNAQILRKLSKRSQDSTVFKPRVVVAHSAGNEDLYKALYMNSITNTKIPINLVSVGSPVSEKDLREVGNDVGVLSVKQVNHPLDPVPGIVNSGERYERIRNLNAISTTIGAGVASAIRGGITKGVTGAITGGILGSATNAGSIIKSDLDKHHPFETYYNNPEFQIQQTIQNILLENELKKNMNQRLSNEK